MSSEKFQSKGGFILASIGAAVGLGNALRFPGLCAKYGGGAFLLIYSVALLVLGLPILNAEIALGRKIKSGAPKCMKSLKRHGEGFGWASCVNSVFTAVIYAGLAGWIIATAATVVPLCLNAPSLTDTEISGYFFDSVLSARNDGVIDGFSLLVAGCILAAWVLMFLCLKGGAKSLSKAARFTVAIPITLLVFLAVRGLFYSTSPEALAALFIPDFSKLSSPELWLTALGQVFFSLSIVVGIMPAYGSYLPEGTNIFKCSLVIAAADFFVSVLASVVLFTTLYGCGLQEQIGASGIITAFAVYPVAITRLFGDCTALNAAVGVLFYSSLAMMAIQSAVSMLEAFLNPFSERGGKPKKKIAARICLIAAPVTLIFATTAAPVAVDISDRFINFYNVLILGIAECILIGASKKTGELAAEINKFASRRHSERSEESDKISGKARKSRRASQAGYFGKPQYDKVWVSLKMPKRLFGVSVAFLSPAVLISLTLYEVFRLCTAGLGYPLWLQIAFGWGLSAAVFALPLILNTKFTPRNIWRRNKLHP
ncbi:MAG: hypothetical protein K2I29_00750 [Clostridia bacterium]|nr:hypothetical protein [Clostridia bacterium]